MSIIGGTTDVGQYRDILVDNTGRLIVVGTGGGGGGGGGDASDATLQQIRDRLPAFLIGGRLAVTVDDPLDVNLPAGIATELTLAALNSKFNSLGQKLAVGSVPVVLASDQAPFQVTIPPGSPLEVTVNTTVTPLNTIITNFPAFTVARIVDATGTAFSSGNRLPVDIGTSLTLSGAVDTELPAAANLADASAESAVPLVGSRIESFNGTTWDRVRSGVTAPGTVVTGMTNQLPMGKYLLSPPTLTDGQFSNLLFSNAGRLLVDTAGTASTTLADGEVNPTTTRVGANQLAWNGTTWDRVRSGLLTPGTSAIGMMNELPMAKFLVAPPTLTNGQLNNFLVDANGRLLVNTSAATATTLSDADANPVTTRQGSNTLSYNGTTWDRVRSGLTGVVASTVGLLNILPVARYNAAFTNLTEGQSNTLRHSLQGKLLVDTYRDVSITIPTLTPTQGNTLTSTAVTINSSKVTVRFKVVGAGNVNDSKVQVLVNSHPTDTTDYAVVAERTVSGSDIFEFVLKGYVNTLRVSAMKEGGSAVSTIDAVVNYGV